LLLEGEPAFHTTVGLPLTPSAELQALLNDLVKQYKDGLANFQININLQALTIATAILLTIGRADSLRLFGNSIPVSWLHFLVPMFLLYLWLVFGFTLHELIWGRIRGVDVVQTLHVADSRLLEYQKAIFHDAGFIDGWIITFVDAHIDEPAEKYSGLSSGLASSSAFFVVFLGTLVAANHATMLATLSIGCRRYLRSTKMWLYWYYLLPMIPLTILIASHLQFAYGGDNRNWLQLYVAAGGAFLMALLLWLSIIVDRNSEIEPPPSALPEEG